jgi:hypothetical protein
VSVAIAPGAQPFVRPGSGPDRPGRRQRHRPTWGSHYNRASRLHSPRAHPHLFKAPERPGSMTAQQPADALHVGTALQPSDGVRQA